MNAPARIDAKGAARCPGASTVQEVIARDGDTGRQPASYRLDSYRFLGDADIPFERYTSPDFFKAEMDHMWPRTWQWACREEHIPEPGDWIVYEIGDESVLVVRTGEDEIKAHINACPHRGTKLRESGSAGHSRELRCRFHG